MSAPHNHPAKYSLRPGGEPLELRYRRLLRLLPPGYRAVHEQEMVDAYVQVSIDDEPELADLTLKSAWPGWGESLAVLRLALRLRWADPRSPQRYRTRADAARVATLLALVALAVLAAQGVLIKAWLLISPPAVTGGDVTLQAPTGGGASPWSVLQNWAFALWIPCLVLAVVGGRGGARWAARTSAVPVLVLVLQVVAEPWDPTFSAAMVAAVVIQIAVLLGLVGAAVSTAGPTAGRRRLLLCAAAGFLVVTVPPLAAVTLSARGVLLGLGYVLLDDTTVWCLVAVVAGATVLVRRMRGAATGTSTLLGVAAVGTAATLLRACSMPTWLQISHTDSGGVLLICAVIQLVVTAVVTLVVGGAAVSRFRALPPVTYRPAGSESAAG